MLLKIAWRNIWRNKLRSGVVITSIVLGIWAGLFVIALSAGLNEQRKVSVIENSISHVQYHHPEFLKDRNAKYVIDDIESVEASIQSDSTVLNYTKRGLVNGMASSARGGNGVVISGIDPEMEARVTTIGEKVVDGAFLSQEGRFPVYIGQALAEKMNVHVRSKIVLTFQDSESEIVAGAFRVAGIYKTVSKKYDEMNVFVRLSDLEKLLHTDNGVNEVAVLLKEFEVIPPFVERQRASYPELKIEPWDEISPELGYADEMMEIFLYLFLGILLAALSFGIVNTMLMAVLERKRELGMLMSVGMNKARIFAMITFETIAIALAGGPLGILMAWLTIVYFQSAGLDLSFYAQGLEEFGIDPIVYPYLEFQYYWSLAIMVVIMAILASVYPARKALKMNPAQAVRAI
ncbi:ABC transporter permease [Cryomorphaceae bacterium]|nr:ABC transporter permease [Cryomorphaceae bacterium]